MLTKYEGPVFSEQCVIELGGFDNGYCPDNYTLRDGEISSIFVSPLTRDANGVYTPEATPSDYKDRSTYGSIMEMRGFGTKALSTEETYTFPGGDEFPVDREHTVAFVVTDTKKQNIDTVRQLQSGSPVAIWYFTKNDGHAFGGNNGIQCIPRNTGLVHEGGDSPLQGQMSFVWGNLYDPVGDLGVVQEAVAPFTFRGKPQPEALTAKESTAKTQKNVKNEN